MKILFLCLCTNDAEMHSSRLFTEKCFSALSGIELFGRKFDRDSYCTFRVTVLRINSLDVEMTASNSDRMLYKPWIPMFNSSMDVMLHVVEDRASPFPREDEKDPNNAESNLVLREEGTVQLRKSESEKQEDEKVQKFLSNTCNCHLGVGFT